MARPKQVSDSELLHAAREVFLRDGPKTAVAQIAEQLGVSAAALFQRAGSKAQLMLRALMPGVPSALKAFSEAPATDSPIRAQLHAQLLELMIFLKAVVPSLIVLRASGLFPPRGGKRRGKGARQGPPGAGPPTPVLLREALGGWLAAAQRDGRIDVRDPRVCAEALLGAMEARCFNAHVGGEDYVLGGDEEFLETLIDGLIEHREPGPAG